jgi:NitT/TauT family transport system permease protein
MSKNKYEYIALAILSFFVLLVAWWLVTAFGLIKPFFLPPPTEVVRAIFQLFQSGNFAKDIGISLFRILIGFGVASIIAIPFGILIGLNKRAEALIEPVVDFIRYTPIPAFIPLFIFWFGIGELEKIVVIASAVFFQLILMVANSVSFTPRQIIDSARTLGATRAEVVWKVIYPHAKPRIFNDLRVSMGWAWAGLILAEIVGSTSGIGYVIIQSQRLLQTANVIGAIVVIGILGLLSDFIFKWLYRFYFPWAPKIDHHVRT